MKVTFYEEKMNIRYDFSDTQIPECFSWFNPPAVYKSGNGLEMTTKARTDFWQRTHYGFRRDDGHCLLTEINDDFCLTTCVVFKPKEKYDQCGLMVRLDENNWIKMGTEYENAEISRLGSVVTNLGYSDWATRDVPTTAEQQIFYRIHKNGPDFLLENSQDGRTFAQMRIAHLHAPFTKLSIGVYACSPIGENFWCRFSWLEISENQWAYKE
jgi:regulation of enolase protein 1 (concanavalin A-like superfamily)